MTSPEPVVSSPATPEGWVMGLIWRLEEDQAAARALADEADLRPSVRDGFRSKAAGIGLALSRVRTFAAAPSPASPAETREGLVPDAAVEAAHATWTTSDAFGYDMWRECLEAAAPFIIAAASRPENDDPECFDVRCERCHPASPAVSLPGERGPGLIEHVPEGQEDFVRGWNAAVRSRWPHPPEAGRTEADVAYKDGYDTGRMHAAGTPPLTAEDWGLLAPVDNADEL